MSPRTRIRDDQAEDQSFVQESEFNEFFGGVVITGTENQTSVVQGFSDYFISSDIVTAISGATVATGTGQIVISSPGLDNFSYETLNSGIEITIPFRQQMIVHNEMILDEGADLILQGTLILEP